MADLESSFPWFRFYTEASHDVKIETISDELQIDYLVVFGAWARILCAASESPIRGSLYVTEMKRFSNDHVTKILHCDKNLSTKLMKSFEELLMIDIDENGAYRVINWKKRQPISDSSTERVRKFRDKKKDETLLKRYGNGVDKDTDKDLKDNTAIAVEGENMGHTDAIKKGDMFDGMVAYSKKNDPIFEYPPATQDVLRIFLKHFPIQDIPRKNKNNKGAYGFWIEGCENIKKACGNYPVEEILAEVGKQWRERPWNVSNPQAIVNVIIGTIAKRIAIQTEVHIPHIPKPRI